MKRVRRNRFEVVVYMDDGARLGWRTKPFTAPTIDEIVSGLRRVADALDGRDGPRSEGRGAEPCVIERGHIPGTFRCLTHGTTGAGYDPPPDTCGFKTGAATSVPKEREGTP